LHDFYTESGKDNIMNSNFLPFINEDKIRSAQQAGDNNELYDLLVQPLHEELYRRQTFNFLDDLSEGQQMLLTYDYLRMQTGQGGFIQFIQNGYAGLLPDLIEQLMKIGGNEMAKLLDDVLKVYVLNRELFIKAQSVAEFAQLYDELKEFEILDDRFTQLNVPAIKIMLTYAENNFGEFGTTATPL
jgi:hypothetical protein